MGAARGGAGVVVPMACIFEDVRAKDVQLHEERITVAKLQKEVDKLKKDCAAKTTQVAQKASRPDKVEKEDGSGRESTKDMFCCSYRLCPSRTQGQRHMKLVKVQKCGKCRMVNYCSQDCQEKDWPEHKPLCKMMCTAAEVGDGEPVAASHHVFYDPTRA